MTTKASLWLTNWIPWVLGVIINNWNHDTSKYRTINRHSNILQEKIKVRLCVYFTCQYSEKQLTHLRFIFQYLKLFRMYDLVGKICMNVLSFYSLSLIGWYGKDK